MTWRITFTQQAISDLDELQDQSLLSAVESELALLREDPSLRPPSYALVGDLSGAYSHRLSFPHRLIYQPLEEERCIKVLRLWAGP